jgi:hypothetical protein
MTWTFPYTPTLTEVQVGMTLASRPAFSRAGRVFLHALGGMMGFCYVITGFSIFAVAIALTGGDPQDRFFWWWLPGMIFAAVMMVLARVPKRLLARAYLNGRIHQGQKITLAPEGIRFDNGRSHSLVAWADVAAIVGGKTLSVAIVGNVGVILPHRLLAQVGDPATIREQIGEWHLAATGDAK